MDLTSVVRCARGYPVYFCGTLLSFVPNVLEIFDAGDILGWVARTDRPRFVQEAVEFLQSGLRWRKWRRTLAPRIFW